MTPEEEWLNSLTVAQDAELLSAEQVASQAATEQLRADLMKLTVAAVILWEQGNADESSRRRLITRMKSRLVNLRLNIRQPLMDRVLKALDLGARQGMRQAAGLSGESLQLDLPAPVREAVERIEGGVRHDLADAASMLDGVTSVRGVEASMAHARQAVTRVERAASWGVNRAAAEGTTAVAEATGSGRLWIGERDACLHCLAYFGHIAGAGEEFPSGLTFGKKGLKGPVPNPPLHPHCRCRVTVWRPEWATSGPGAFPESLKREAERSVARGWSLPSESNASRLDAADRLLRRGTGLPQSVQDYAARSVKRGAFPRGRTFPV